MKKILLYFLIFIFCVLNSSNYAASKNKETYEYLDLFGQIFDRVRSSYVDEVTDEELIEKAIDGMLTGLDPHSGYMDAEIYVEMKEETKETHSGEFISKGLHDRRTVLLSEPISPKLTQRVMASLLLMDHEDPKSPIDVLINSPGGSADDGFAIYDALRFVRAPIRTINVGLSASAATIIMLGAEKEHRYALPNARIMIHQPLGQIPGTSAENIKRWAEQIIKLRAM